MIRMVIISRLTVGWPANMVGVWRFGSARSNPKIMEPVRLLLTGATHWFFGWAHISWIRWPWISWTPVRLPIRRCPSHRQPWSAHDSSRKPCDASGRTKVIVVFVVLRLRDHPSRVGVGVGMLRGARGWEPRVAYFSTFDFSCLKPFFIFQCLTLVIFLYDLWK